jgi:hypothetical protein
MHADIRFYLIVTPNTTHTHTHTTTTVRPYRRPQVPSHWFEYYARSPAVVSQWARHHRDGSPVPPQLLQEALQVTQRLPAIDLQTQILYSAADQVSRVPLLTVRGDVEAVSFWDIIRAHCFPTSLFLFVCERLCSFVCTYP